MGQLVNERVRSCALVIWKEMIIILSQKQTNKQKPIFNFEN